MIHVRAYRDEDWNAVCRIHDAARPIELEGSCDPRAFVPIEDDPVELEDLCQCTILVAEEAESVVGFAGFDGSYLGWLYVDPGHHRKGIGRMLLRAAVQSTSGEHWTIVLDGNTPAIRLYESEGFNVDKTFDSDNAGYPCTCLRMVRPGR